MGIRRFLGKLPAVLAASFWVFVVFVPIWLAVHQLFHRDNDTAWESVRRTMMVKIDYQEHVYRYDRIESQASLDDLFERNGQRLVCTTERYRRLGILRVENRNGLPLSEDDEGKTMAGDLYLEAPGGFVIEYARD